MEISTADKIQDTAGNFYTIGDGTLIDRGANCWAHQGFEVWRDDGRMMKISEKTLMEMLDTGQIRKLA